MTQLAPLFHHASAGKVRDIKALSRTGPTGVACMMAVLWQFKLFRFNLKLNVERRTLTWPRDLSGPAVTSTYPQHILVFGGVALCIRLLQLHLVDYTEFIVIYPDERRISPDSMYLLLTTPLEWTRRQRSTFHLRQSSVAALPRCQAACRLSLTTSDSLPEVLLAISQEVYLEGACTAS